MVVDPGEAEVGEGQPAEPFEGRRRRGGAAGDVLQELVQAGVDHVVT